MSCCGPASVAMKRGPGNQENAQVEDLRASVASRVAQRRLPEKAPGCCGHSSSSPERPRAPSIDSYSPVIKHGWKKTLDPKNAKRRDAMLRRAHQIIHGYGNIDTEDPATTTNCCNTKSATSSSLAKRHRSRTVSSASKIPIASSPPVDEKE